jgi:PII-like signaling protein
LEVNAMMLPTEGYLLRIFIGESDRHNGELLHEWLVMKAREQGLAGATVLRGMLGFGAHSRLHSYKIERLSQDLPIVVEIVDTREKLEKFLELIDHEIEEGMATLEEVRIHFYRSGKSGSAQKSD